MIQSNIQLIKAVSHVYLRWKRNMTYIKNDLSFNQSTYKEICRILLRMEKNYPALRGRGTTVDCN